MPEPPAVVEPFDRFWGAYPRKEAKPRARKAWDKAIKARVDLEVVIDSAVRYAARRLGEDPQFTALPATWLNDRRWEDAPTAEYRKLSNGEKAFEMAQRHALERGSDLAPYLNGSRYLETGPGSAAAELAAWYGTPGRALPS